jgi:hypothetical protein
MYSEFLLVFFSRLFFRNIDIKPQLQLANVGSRLYYNRKKQLYRSCCRIN